MYSAIRYIRELLSIKDKKPCRFYVVPEGGPTLLGIPDVEMWMY